jgi:hypothetical protein
VDCNRAEGTASLVFIDDGNPQALEFDVNQALVGTRWT